MAADPEFEVGEWGTPGDYRAPFIPTQPGTYTFHVTGSVDGTDVDFSTTSGPKTFSDVVDPAEAMFPPVEAPSSADLAAKISAEAARTDEAVASAQNAADTGPERGDRGRRSSPSSPSVSRSRAARRRRDGAAA